MEIQSAKYKSKVFFSVFNSVLLLCFIVSFKMAAADIKPLTPDKTEKEEQAEKIIIKSDKLMTDSTADFAEFVGNVKATMESTIITSERLKIFYKSNADNDTKIDAGEEGIKKIIATGNVIIRTDKRVAVTDNAEYTPSTGVIVLTGKNSKVTSGDNSVTGEKITIYRNEDRTMVERGNEKQVEAIIFSGSKSEKPALKKDKSSQD